MINGIINDKCLITFLLCQIEYWEEFTNVLDVIWNTFPYPYQRYDLLPDLLKRDIHHRILPGLDLLIDCHLTGIFPWVNEENRYIWFNSQLYPVLESSIQKDLIHIS